jgi:hypothetical protein
VGRRTIGRYRAGDVVLQPTPVARVTLAASALAIPVAGDVWPLTRWPGLRQADVGRWRAVVR